MGFLMDWVCTVLSYIDALVGMSWKGVKASSTSDPVEKNSGMDRGWWSASMTGTFALLCFNEGTS